ncbi:MAG TPA: diaminopimelate decarboxylase [Gammaproteobacteria bacterium]|nr:diaminopimelate decarboxylase [Gammaproteobacteria bacterium]
MADIKPIRKDLVTAASARAYEPPALTPLPFFTVNKQGLPDMMAATQTEEGESVAALLETFGSPLYMVSEQRLREDFRAFKQAFTSPGIDTRVAYSIKTNYLPAICSIILDEGGWAEIVSGMEYDLVRALGVPGPEIIFNGPHKTYDELYRALSEGAIVNIDNFDELTLVEQIATELNRPTRVGIRISFKYGQFPWTKFGFSDDNGDCQRAMERIARHPKLQLELLHNHGGTFLLLHEVYENSADRIIDVARRARALGLAPTMVDLGGGFPSVNTLKPAYDLPGGSSRGEGHLFRYSQAICGRLQRAKDVFGGRPTLVLEPGRAIVDAAVQLACTVVGRKEVAGTGSAIIVDAGVNLVPTACYYDHGIKGANEESENYEGAYQPVRVFGSLCMQSDVLREQAMLPPLQPGDPLVISNVGAYCHTQSSQFIQARPATVLLGKNGPELIRRRETWKDIFALDEVPERLRGSDFGI